MQRSVPCILCLCCFCILLWVQAIRGQDSAPDIRTVKADLTVPPIQEGSPAPGRRVRWYPQPDLQPRLYGVLTLPTNYDPKSDYPLIVELPGNGGYRSPFGDECDGTPDGCKLGWGISGGPEFIWLALPFVTGADLSEPRELALQWWGSPPEFSGKSTAAFCQAAVKKAIHDFSINPEAVVLSGFSRGAIGCNFVGLQDDNIAQLWCGMIAYSHYDGSRDWGLPNTDRASAAKRLSRLRCPQLICHEDNDAEQSGLTRTRNWLAETELDQSNQIEFLSTGFRNHNDAWVLRPSPAREQLRKWIRKLPSVREVLATQEKR
ncbi:MAG: hypothetical protein AAGG44_13210 [Planctomycetota bacterium]